MSERPICKPIQKPINQSKCLIQNLTRSVPKAKGDRNPIANHWSGVVIKPGESWCDGFMKMWMFFENVNVLWKCLYGGNDSYQTYKSVWMSTIINVSVWFYVLKDWCRKDSGSRTSLFKMLGLRFVFYEKRLRNVKVKMEVFIGFATCLYYLKCFHWLLTMMVMKMMMMILMFIIIIMFMMMR